MSFTTKLNWLLVVFSLFFTSSSVKPKSFGQSDQIESHPFIKRNVYEMAFHVYVRILKEQID